MYLNYARYRLFYVTIAKCGLVTFFRIWIELKNE